MSHPSTPPPADRPRRRRGAHRPRRGAPGGTWPSRRARRLRLFDRIRDAIARFLPPWRHSLDTAMWAGSLAFAVALCTFAVMLVVVPVVTP